MAVANFLEVVLLFFKLPVGDSSCVYYKQVPLSRLMDTEMSFVKDVLQVRSLIKASIIRSRRVGIAAVKGEIWLQITLLVSFGYKVTFSASEAQI